MKLTAIVLFISLVCSIALNVYLFGRLHLSQVEFSQTQISSERESLLEAPKLPATIQEHPIDVAFEKADVVTALQQLKILLTEDPQLANTKIQQWFQTLYGTINSEQHRLGPNRYRQTLQFIQSYLREYPYDPHFLLLEVMVNANQDEPTEQLGELYELLAETREPELMTLIQTQITQRLRYSVERLIQISAWDVLAALLESLLSYDPDNRYILINLAKAYSETNQFGLLESTLAYLPEEDKEAQALREAMQHQLTEPRPTREITAGIPMQKTGEHFVIDALLNNLVPAKLMIDTGASTSVISQSLFDAMPNSVQPRFVGTYPVNTAGGKVMAPIYRFNMLAVDDFTVRDIAIVVLPIDGLAADGLLGMNFLRAFHFQMDQTSSELFLTRR